MEREIVDKVILACFVISIICLLGAIWTCEFGLSGKLFMTACFFGTVSIILQLGVNESYCDCDDEEEEEKEQDDAKDNVL